MIVEASGCLIVFTVNRIDVISIVLIVTKIKRENMFYLIDPHTTIHLYTYLSNINPSTTIHTSYHSVHPITSPFIHPLISLSS